MSLKYGIHMTEKLTTILAESILRLLQDFRRQESKVKFLSIGLFSLIPTLNLLSWGKQPHLQLKAAVLASHLVYERGENSRSCFIRHEEAVEQT